MLLRDHLRNWQPPAEGLRITTLDTHTAGEPLRIVTGGLPELPGATILDRRRWAQAHLEPVRKLLLREPRGHAEMYGCLLTPAVSAEADFGVLFLHNEGYSTMCGHAILALATVMVETGALPATGPTRTVRIDTPAGLVTAVAHCDGGRVQDVRFHNVPSFVVALDETVDVPGYGPVRYDLAFGGAFYAYVEAAQVGLTGALGEYQRLVEAGRAIKHAVMAARPIVHPFEPDLGFLYGTIFTAAPQSAGAHSRHVCIFADGQVDRSPTGTGVSGRMPLLYARGAVDLGETVVIESILGTCFTGRVVAETMCGPHAAVIPEVGGSAAITGQHTFLLRPTDPLPEGFLPG